MKKYVSGKVMFRAVLVIVFIAFLSVLVEEFLDYRRDLRYDRAIDHLVSEMVLTDDMAVQQVADYVRNFIWVNSKHKIDEEFYSHWGEIDTIVSKMLLYKNGKVDEPPHMECSSRSGLMERAMRKLGYRTRTVNIYGHKKDFPSHTFLEIYNPDTESWEAQDVDYNIFWRDKESGNRIGIEAIISRELDMSEPCMMEGMCGWTVETKPGKTVNKTRYKYGMAVVIDRANDTRTLLVNETLFPLDQPVKTKDGDLTYCEYRDKDCRKEIIFVGK